MRWMVLTALLGCRSGAAPATGVDDSEEVVQPAGEGTVDVTTVTTSGEAGSYTFSVALRSDETGCPQYADWWEVVGEDGSLLYRRVLGHSHPDEQPFTRSGGPVGIDPDERVWVRGHMNTTGYRGTPMVGSVASGFAAGEQEPGWAAELANEQPLPDGCAF